jgi:hypothetical protein
VVTVSVAALLVTLPGAALAAGKRLCGPFAWRDRPPDLTRFRAGSETAALARGAAAELGDLKDAQGKPEVGRYANRRGGSRAGHRCFSDHC